MNLTEVRRRRRQASGSPNPLTILGAALFLWLRADLGVTRDGSNRVSQWSDQSGKGNHLTQATGVDQPLWVDGVKNAKPVVRYSAAGSEFMSRAALDSTHVQAFAVFLALTALSTTGTMAAFQSNGSSTPTIQIPVATLHHARLNASVALTTTTVDDGAWRGFLCVANGVSSAVYVSDFTTAVVSGNAGGGSLASARMGANNAGAQFFDGDIAELIAMDGATTQAQRTQIRNYLNSRYALGIA